MAAGAGVVENRRHWVCTALEAAFEGNMVAISIHAVDTVVQLQARIVWGRAERLWCERKAMARTKRVSVSGH